MTPFLLTLALILAIIVGSIACAQDSAAGQQEHRREWERSDSTRSRPRLSPRRPLFVTTVIALLVLMFAAMSQAWVPAVLGLAAVTVVVSSYGLVTGARGAGSTPP